MKLSKMVELLEKNPALKEKMVENCVAYFGSDRIQPSKPLQIKIESREDDWWGAIVYNEHGNDSLAIHDLVLTIGVKEYNEKKVAEYLIQGYTHKQIIEKLNIGKVRLKRIKQKIYDKIEQAKQENKF